MNTKKATISDVAKLAGVSKMTVSRFLNGTGTVAAETKVNIQDAIQQLDFHPSSVARRMNGKANRAIAVIASKEAITDAEVSITYFSEMMRMLISLGQKKDFAIVVTASDQGISGKPDYIKLIEERSVCALVMLDLVENDPRLAEIEKRNIPMVVLGEPLRQRKNLYCVTNDDKEGGLIATEHLIKQGFHRIAYLGAPHSLRSSALRLEGFRLALARHQMEEKSEWIMLNEPFGTESIESGYEGMKDLLAMDKRPDAVFCSSDLRALGAMRAIQEAGLRIPEDMGLVGYDDLFLAEFAPIPLTTISQPLLTMARRSIDILDQVVDGHVIKQPNNRYNPLLVPRKSSRS